MATAQDVVNYMASKLSFFGEMHFQKLAYYAQAWSLAWDGVPMFDEPIEAWQKGPVVCSLRHFHPRPDPDAPLTEAQRATVDAVLDYYGRMSGKTLSQLTHDETPWQEAWGDRAPHLHGSDVISRETMRRTAAKQARAMEAPRRRPVGTEIAVLDEVLSHSRQARRHWSRTLELLGR